MSKRRTAKASGRGWTPAMIAEIERLNRTNEAYQRQRQRDLVAALEKAEPAPRWTLGMLEYLRQLEAAAETRRGEGMPYVVARLQALNYLTCWCSDTKETRWPQVNRHLWRIQALYLGGDCYLAGWPGAKPHEPIWKYRPPPAGNHASGDSDKQRCRR